MPRLIEKLRQLWESFWALPRLWKGSAAGGAILVLVALTVGVVLATDGGDNTAVGGVVQGPTPMARVPTATPTRVPTPTPNPTPTPVPTATISALGEQQPPSAGNPPPPEEAHTSPSTPTPRPNSTPRPTATPTPTPTPNPDPLSRIPSAYWIDARGDVVIYIYYPDIICQSDYLPVGEISCRSPGAGWNLNCLWTTDWQCSHSHGGDVRCIWDRQPPHDTSCISQVWDGQCRSGYDVGAANTRCQRNDSVGTESLSCSWEGLTASCDWDGLLFQCVRDTPTWSCQRM